MRVIVRRAEVGAFVGIDGVVISRFENVSRWLVVVVRWVKVSVIFRFIDRVVWAPFDDETAFLNKGVAYMYGERFNASNGSARKGKDGPVIASKILERDMK